MVFRAMRLVEIPKGISVDRVQRRGLVTLQHRVLGERN